MEASKKEVRVRFAPSPTGFLHLGGARTALFNWLFAKHEKGKFLLRIEDTDKERSQKIYEEDILNNLKWLGLIPDEPFIRQSERKEIYKHYLEKLIKENKAYYCFCTPEELEVERQSQLSQGLTPKYSGRCRNLTPEETNKKIEKGEKTVIRLKIPNIEISFNDLIRGKITYNLELIGDIIIAKSPTEPLYNFAVIVDDFETNITHVIRGEEHLANTPKQIILQKALDFPPVNYAHLPLILGPDRKKLSKRYLDKAIKDYKNEGYLKEAILNFLVLLGWHPIKDREIISVEEMIEEFSLERVQKAGAVFNPEKLDWLNGYYLRHLETDKIFVYLKEFVPEKWLENEEFLKKVITLEKERLKKLSQFPQTAEFFFNLPEYPKERLIWRGSTQETTLNNLETLLKIIETETLIPQENNNILEIIKEKIINFANEKGKGEVLWPFRVALSGLEASPDPLSIMETLVKNETIRRLNIAINKLKRQE